MLLKLMVIITVIVAFSTNASEVIWFYDLSQLPEFWEAYLFTFSGAGALLDESGTFEPKSSSSDWNWGYLVSETYMIPPDLDSLVLHVPQNIYLYAVCWNTGLAYVWAQVDLQVNKTNRALWYRNVYVSGEAYEYLTDTLPIHAVIDDLSCGDIVSFAFHSAGGGYWGHAEIEWLLWDAQLTAYGTLPLIPATWAGIKSQF